MHFSKSIYVRLKCGYGWSLNYRNNWWLKQADIQIIWCFYLGQVSLRKRGHFISMGPTWLKKKNGWENEGKFNTGSSLFIFSVFGDSVCVWLKKIPHRSWCCTFAITVTCMFLQSQTRRFPVDLTGTSHLRTVLGRPDMRALVFHQNANNIICNIQGNIIVVLIGGGEGSWWEHLPTPLFHYFNYNGWNKREHAV